MRRARPSWRESFEVASLAPVLVLAHAALGVPTEPTADGAAFAFPGLGLTVTLPEGLTDVEPGQPEAGADTLLVHWWNARLGDARFAASLAVFDAADWSLREPGDVVELVVDQQRSGPRRFEVLEQYYLPGKVGYAPFASVVVADVALPDQTSVSQRHFVLGGLLRESGYALHVLCEPLPSEEEEATIRAFLAQGIAYDGPERVAEWTDEEVVERWRASTPEFLHEDFVEAMRKRSTAKKVCIRTRNYIVLTNSSGGKHFGKKLEENYEEIVDVFPFVEVEGRRLLPVFLFKTREDYIRFYMHDLGADRERAEKSGGFAFRDYYATTYEAPKDPVHIHEQTHQIFGNRLRLGGGGSWFQEGVAEYVETSENDRNVVARHVEEGTATPLVELVQLGSLLHSTQEDLAGGSRAGDNYKQASLLIEFLRESDFGEERFEDFLYTLGKVPRGDLEAIEAGFRRVYGVGLAEVEAEWRGYCEER